MPKEINGHTFLPIPLMRRRHGS